MLSFLGVAMFWKNEWKPLLFIVSLFLLFFYLPVGTSRFDNAIMEAMYLVKWYAQEHVLLCLIPAFFIAGAIAVFISKDSVMKYLGPSANKFVAYGVSSISGSILAVCSCTVLPLFSGIYKMGAGLGPATAFLYSGPAINVLAIILTARVLGLELGIARAVGAILFSVVIGLIMHFIYKKEEITRANVVLQMESSDVARPLWQNALFFFFMIAILVFVNWGKPVESSGIWFLIYSYKWILTTIFSILLGFSLIFWIKISWWKIGVIFVLSLIFWFIFPNRPKIIFSVAIVALSFFTSMDKGESNEWFGESWGFAKQILPLLLIGVLIAGFLLGRPGHEGIIPAVWVQSAVGGNSIWANLFSSVAGAFMYFATLTEIPILQGLLGAGMGKGPALALLLAGPALSLPNMLVIKSVMGWQKTIVYVLLVIVMATVSGLIYGALF